MTRESTSSEPKYVSIPEYARFLGISRIAVYQRVKKGQIPAKKIGRNYVVLLEPNTQKTIPYKITPEHHCSIAEYAAKVGISRIAVFQKIKRGQLQAVKCGRNYIIPLDPTGKPFMSEQTPTLSKKSVIQVKTHLSIPELAQQLGLSRVEVFQRVKSGKIQAEKIGRNYVVDLQTLREGRGVGDAKQTQLKETFISVPELAKEMGLSRVAVFNKVKSGAIKAKKIGRNYVIRKKDLEKSEA